MQPVVLFGLNNPMDSKRAVAALPPIAQQPAPAFFITGVSRDSAGAALGGMTCTLFRVDLDTDGRKVYMQVAQVLSDGSGNYSFPASLGLNYRITTDQVGVAGISADTLLGT